MTLGIGSWRVCMCVCVACCWQDTFCVFFPKHFFFSPEELKCTALDLDYIMQLADLQAVTEGSTSSPLCRVVHCAHFWLHLRRAARSGSVCHDRLWWSGVMDRVPDKVQSPGEVRWRRPSGWNLKMFFFFFFLPAPWVAFRSLFDSLPVLEVADVWLKANFSQALESKWKRLVFYGWLPGSISKAVFSVHLRRLHAFVFDNRRVRRWSKHTLGWELFFFFFSVYFLPTIRMNCVPLLESVRFDRGFEMFAQLSVFFWN